MRITNLGLAATILSSVGFAQNQIEIWPGVTNFTSRGSVGNNATGGEILQGLNDSSFTGVGDNGAIARVDAFQMLLQDQNTDSQEDYHVIYRSGTDTGGPNATNAGLLCRIGPFTSPPRGAGGPIQANVVTHAFTTVQCLTLCGFTGFGVELQHPGTIPWSANGLSCHMSRGDGTFANTVQRAAATALNAGWQIIDSGSGATVSTPSLKRSWRFKIITDTATLQMGNGGALYGQGGSDPDVSVPFSARARYGAASGVDESWLFVSAKRICPGISMQPGMRIYLGSIHGPFIVPVPASGEAIHALGTTPATSPKLTVHFQAAGIVKKTKHCILTNLTTTRF